jgi:hypothetical protein
MRIPLVAVLALFVAVSCDQQPAAPQADQVAEAPTLSFVNGPTNPGNSPIDREFDEWCYWCASFDAAEYYYATHQSAYEYFCNAGPTVQWDYQEINNGRLIVNAQTRDQPLFIYNMTDLFDAYAIGLGGDWDSFCTFLTNEWLYQGTHDMNATETWNADLSKGHEQMMGTGMVHDHADNPYTYTEKQKYMQGKGWTHRSIVIE